MTDNPISVLIIAKSYPLLIGLRALLTAMPQVEIVHEANEIATALKTTFEPEPVLVLLDTDLADGETWLTVRRVKARWAQSRHFFLAGDVWQQKEAEAAGADIVMLKGASPARVVAALVRLMPQRVDKDATVVSARRQSKRSEWQRHLRKLRNATL